MSDAQTIETSALAFIRAVLRREEDEPITEDERATFNRLYLPHAADDPARIDRKSANRTRAAEALETGMPSAAILRQQEIFERYADERERKAKPMTSMQHTPTTADVGLVLANYMRQTEPAGGDPHVYRDLIGLMLNSSASTPTDALALVSWLSEFLPIAHALLPEDADETGGPRALLSNACDMAAKARVALELHTGLAAETFIGRSDKAN